MFSKLKGDGEFCEDNAYGCMQKIVKLIEKKWEEKYIESCIILLHRFDYLTKKDYEIFYCK